MGVGVAEAGVHRKGVVDPQALRFVGTCLIEVAIMRSHRRNRPCAAVRDGNGARRRIISIAPHVEPESDAGVFLAALVEFVEWCALLVAGDDVEIGEGFAPQPISAPVGREIAAVTPDRALLHAAHRLPNRLAALDVRPGEDGFAAFGLHLFRDGRRCLVDLVAEVQQSRKHHGHADREDDPQPSDREHMRIGGHDKPPLVYLSRPRGVFPTTFGAQCSQ